MKNNKYNWNFKNAGRLYNSEKEVRELFSYGCFSGFSNWMQEWFPEFIIKNGLNYMFFSKSINDRTAIYFYTDFVNLGLYISKVRGTDIVLVNCSGFYTFPPAWAQSTNSNMNEDWYLYSIFFEKTFMPWHMDNKPYEENKKKLAEVMDEVLRDI